MTQSGDRGNPLRGNPARQAVDSNRGTFYQIWRSVYAWLELKPDELLYLEGAEDFDVLGDAKATTTQVKDTERSGNITLRSNDVVDAIGHFWEIRNLNTGRKLLYRFLTTSQIGVERESPFGPGLGGLELWMQCRQGGDGVERLRDFLMRERRLPPEILEFLRQAKIAEIRDDLIHPIEWSAGNAATPHVKDAVQRRLAYLGETYGVPPDDAGKVADRLFTEACEFASRKENRVLDRAQLLTIFQDAVMVRVPRREVQALGRPETGDHQRFDITSRIFPSPPPMLSELLGRGVLLAQIQQGLGTYGIVVLSGSTGMGKTTLASMLLRSHQEKCLWADLRGLDTEGLSRILRHVGDMLDQSAGKRTIVLDNLDGSCDLTRCERHLGALLYTAEQYGCGVIITAQGGLPSRLALSLNVGAERTFKIPPVDKSEISQYLDECGCPTPSLSIEWAEVIWRDSKGHPQLVHAHVKNLLRRGWPSPIDGQVDPDKGEIDAARSEARSLLRQLPSAAARGLVYKISLLRFPFRRDHALKIGEIEPQGEYPGESFDILIGPWVEPLSKEYFRISPLIENVANEIWGRDRVIGLHASVAVAFLDSNRLTTKELAAAFFHAWEGREERVLSSVALTLIYSPGHVWRELAYDLNWLIDKDILSDRGPFPEKRQLVIFLRHIQFRIAAEVDRNIASSVANLWNEEIDGSDLVNENRADFIVRLLTTYKIRYSVKRLVELVAELAAADRQQPFLVERLPTAPLAPWMLGPDGVLDPVGVFGRFLPSHCNGGSDVEEFFEALTQVPEDIRQRILQVFRVMHGEARLLLDTVWMREVDRGGKDWPGCLRILNMAAEKALAWDAGELAAAAFRGLAIVEHEYLHDAQKSIDTLDRARELLGEVPDIEDKRANILLEQGRAADALAIWERILPSWSSPPEQGDTAPMYANRQAAIAAVRCGNLARGETLFLDGHRRGLGLEHRPVLAMGFLADAAMVQWRAGDMRNALSRFAEVVERLDTLPDPMVDPYSYSLHRRVGRAILWVKSVLIPSENKVPEAVVGMCSEPGRTPGFHEKDPLGPVDTLWLLLAEIELALGFDDVVYDRAFPRTLDSRHAASFSARTVFIRHQVRRGTLSELPKQLILLATEMRRLHPLKEAGISLFGAELPQNLVALEEADYTFVCDSLLAGLIVLFNRQSLDEETLGRWKDQALGHAAVWDWIDQISKWLLDRPSQVRLLLREQVASSRRLIPAAFIVGTGGDAAPSEIFVAHYYLMDNMLLSPWRAEVGKDLAQILATRWESIAAEPALLRTPSITVPAIAAACTGNKEGWPRIAEILLAAYGAVSVGVSRDAIHKLRRIAAAGLDYQRSG